MLRITERTAQLSGPAQDRILLTYDQRKRGRLRVHTEQGQEVGLFLERGHCLTDGEIVSSECGYHFQVVSAPEDVATASTEDPVQFARICYHLGNRHLPLEIGQGWCRFHPDHVLEDLCRSYGLQVIRESAPFQPENGAYGAHGHKGHGHSHQDSGHHHH